MYLIMKTNSGLRIGPMVGLFILALFLGALAYNIPWGLLLGVNIGAFLWWFLKVRRSSEDIGNGQTVLLMALAIISAGAWIMKFLMFVGLFKFQPWF